MPIIIRRLLCKIGLHSWLTSRKARIWKGDVVEVFQMEDICGYCPKTRPSEDAGGDWNTAPIDAEIVLVEPNMLIEVTVDE